ncbi:putative disease resistance protein RXW24L [Sesamum alatum]|uniref:Disease resistance protein RXW24L n=1 Tax=Sesamum alatum TaxID=300844 RepID=A0AAE2CKB7_9LAMI|nr:putative disease resistance protein RXW24L [Sesamum alatum]
MADAAVTFFLENLKTVLLKHHKLVSGETIKEHEAYLKNEMPLIKALQKDAERRQAADERIRLFSRNIMDLIYRIQDAMENITMELELTPFRRMVQNSSTDVFGEIDAEMEEIRNRVEYLSRIAQVIGVTEAAGGESSSGTANRSSKLSRQANDHQRKEHFVGRVEEMEVLDSYIKDPECRVIAIWGLGGLGKTALAKKLYQDVQEDKNHFYAVAWVYVSQDFEARRVFEDLYRKFYPYHREDVSEIPTRELARRVCEIQRDRKCLVVLDEIWSRDAWETLRIAFPSGDTASKILMTTRVRQAAEAVDIVAEKRYIHRLRYLTEDESCQLFRERVLLMDLPDNEADKIIEMGKKVVKFCDGLPLPVINFLQFVATKHHLEDLKVVHQNLESYVRKSQESAGSTLQLLSLSYDDLPDFLKPCFLYVGNFRENIRIDAEKLYLFWVAEGLISLQDCEEGERLKDVAARYLNDLAQRSIVEVQEEELPAVTMFKSCRLNPLMQKLSLFKSKEQGFFKVEDFGRGRRPMHDSLSQNQAYRLAINFDKYEDGCDFPLEDNEKKHIRCLLFSVKKNRPRFVWPRKLSSLVAFKYLRILDFDGFDFRVIKRPQDIGKLVHLKYLSFRNCILPKLPSSVGNLTQLLILDLRVRPLSKITIPNVLWKLKKLMHLYFPESFDTRHAGKLRLEGLTKLETLVNFNTGMLNFEGLFQLTNLRYISSKIAGSSEEIVCITKRMNGDDLLCTSLEIRNFDCYAEEKHSVFRNVLECQSLAVLFMEGHVFRLPVHDRISQNLAKIVLVGSQLVEDPMKTLQHLPKLRVLILNDDAFVENEMICSATGFIELENLELWNLPNLGEWIVEDRAMPKLSTLAIVNCRKLKMPPEGLQFVRRLQQMNVWEVHEELEKSLEKVEEQMRMDNVQPLPKIMFKHPSGDDKQLGTARVALHDANSDALVAEDPELDSPCF